MRFLALSLSGLGFAHHLMKGSVFNQGLLLGFVGFLTGTVCSFYGVGALESCPRLEVF